MPYIADLEIDEHNEVEMGRHRVTPREVRQALRNGPRFLRNKSGHAATHLMIGLTDGGRLLTVPIAPTLVEGVWRPASAWDSSPGERAAYRPKA